MWPLTEEDMKSVITSNKAKGPVYNATFREHKQSSFHVIESFLRTMRLKEDKNEFTF